MNEEAQDTGAGGFLNSTLTHKLEPKSMQSLAVYATIVGVGLVIFNVLLKKIFNA